MDRGLKQAQLTVIRAGVFGIESATANLKVNRRIHFSGIKILFHRLCFAKFEVVQTQKAKQYKQKTTPPSKKSRLSWVSLSWLNRVMNYRVSRAGVMQFRKLFVCIRFDTQFETYYRDT